MSEYWKKLLVESPDVAQRYMQKISKICDIDPFSIDTSQLCYNADSFPSVTSMDIVSYLVLSTSFYTGQQMKAFKSLNAYKFFEAGFVHKCGAITINEYIVVIGFVKHSQRMNEHPLHVWVMCQQDGSVVTAHCTCMAGAGEVCSHVGAVLYALEYIHNSKRTTSCTDLLSLWDEPNTSKVESQQIRQMDFGRIISSNKLRNQHIPPFSADEMVDFLKQIEEAGSSSVIMRVMQPFASNIENSSDDEVENVYVELYRKENEQLTYEELLQLATPYKNLQLEENLCWKVRSVTKGQAKNRAWFHHRVGRITSSNFKSVCKTSIEKPSLSIIKNICYPLEVMFQTKATLWGAKHEKDGLNDYQLFCSPVHENISLEEVGLCLNSSYPQFGASPDALVHCECCGSGCVEVKCPYLLKDNTIDEYSMLKTSCLYKNNINEISLKRNHMYYYQVQMQMAITNTAFCDFVVWSPKEFFHERITFNEDFWASESLKAIEFHNKVILPEMIGRFFTKTTEPLGTWCLCNGEDDGRPMIFCNNDDCSIKWYHFECVGLIDEPTESWLCYKCKEN